LENVGAQVEDGYAEEGPESVPGGFVGVVAGGPQPHDFQFEDVGSDGALPVEFFHLLAETSLLIRRELDTSTAKEDLPCIIKFVLL
jgi:hypothetical protein